jgi:hypothetical protein
MLRYIPLFLVSALLTASLLTGCAGSGATVSNSNYRTNLGSVTYNNIVNLTERALVTRFGYRYQREEVSSPENIYLETEWKDVRPTDDETALGVQFVRSRFVVTARVRNRTTGDLSANILSNTEYRMQNTPDWVDAPMTPQRREYVKDVVDYLQRELRSGWRE